jgi:Tfp pilus assembly protein PilO
MGGIREQVLTGVTAFAACALFAWLVVYPQQAKHRALQDELQAVSDDIALRLTRCAAAVETERALEQCRRRLGSMEARVPPEDHLGSFLEQLSAVAADAELINANVVPQPPYVTKGLGILPIDMDFESDFPSLFAFLKHVESLPRAVRIASLSAARVQEGDDRLEIEMTLQIFFEAS